MYILLWQEMAFSKATSAGSLLGVNNAALELALANGRSNSVEEVWSHKTETITKVVIDSKTHLSKQTLHERKMLAIQGS